MYLLPELSPDEILIYLRKSRTDDPTLSVAETLAKHEQMLNEWVQRNLGGQTVPEENRFREIVSGETIEARPEINKLLRKIESPRYKAILIVEPQRLSRGDLEDIGRLIKILRYTNTIVITLQYTYDLNDERDRDAFERELKRGNEFLEYQKRIMGNGRRLSVENGNFIGQIPPYGYEKVRIRDGKKYCHTLRIIPEEADTVRMIFRMYADGSGATSISERLNAIGVPTRTGAPWTAASIYPMLDNEHYLGMVRWEARKSVRLVENGEIIVSRPRQKQYELHPGRHDPIISQALWDTAHLRRGKIARKKESFEMKNPLAGLIYCECGRAMVRRTYNGKAVPRMLCDHQKHCGNASCSMDEIIEAVANILRQSLADFRVRINSGEDTEAKAHLVYLRQLEAHLAELEAKELAQWDKYTQEDMPRAIFDKLNQRVLAEKLETQKAIAAASAAVPRQIDIAERTQTFQSALDLLLDPNACASEQNELLKACIRRIWYSRKRIENKRPEPMQLRVELQL